MDDRTVPQYLYFVVYLATIYVGQMKNMIKLLGKKKSTPL